MVMSALRRFRSPLRREAQGVPPSATDAFTVIFRAYHDESTNQNGFGFNVIPNGVGYGLDSGTLQNALPAQRR